MSKTKTKKDHRKGHAKSHDNVEEITPEFIAEIAVDIAMSPIDDAHKAMFLYTIVNGTFNLKLYERYQELLKEYREELVAEAKKLDEEYKRIKAEYDTKTKELGEATLDIIEEVSVYGQKIENNAIDEIEKFTGEHESLAVESIRKKLKKSQ